MDIPRPDPNSTPITPPTLQRVTDSSRNWSRMFPRLAPIALRTPISRVRSVTLTSMMFITPIPPTSSATIATANVRMKISPLILFHKSRK